MAKIKISQMDAASSLDGTELFEVVQDGSNKKVTAAQVAELAGGSAPKSHTVVWDMDTDTYSNSGATTEAHLNVKQCIISNTGEFLHYVLPGTLTREDTLEPCALTQEDNHLMVEIPPTYTRWDFSGDKLIVGVSSTPKSGFELDPAFNGITKPIYVGVTQAVARTVSGGVKTLISGLNLDNNTSMVDTSTTLLASTYGVKPMVGLTRGEFRTLASNNGAGFGILDFTTWNLLLKLYLTQFGDWNSQKKVGAGNVDRAYVESSSNDSDSPHTLTNAVNTALQGVTGGVTTPDPGVVFLGIENLWGNAYQFVDGINIKDSEVFVCPADSSTYVDDQFTSPYISLGAGNTLPLPSGEYISKLHKVKNYFIPGLGGGDSDTGVTDRSYASATGNRVLLVGGSASFGLSAGVGGFRGSSSSAVRARSRSSRVMFRSVS